MLTPPAIAAVGGPRSFTPFERPPELGEESLVAESTTLAPALTWDHNPVVTSDGSTSLAVWQGGSTVYGSLISPDGSPGSTFVISKRSEVHARPAVASNGSLYAVVWQSTTQEGVRIFAALVDSSGEIKSPRILVSSHGHPQYAQGTPDIASDGSTFFITWYENDRLVGARLDSGGALLDPTPITISNSAGYGSAQSVSWGAGSYLVVWTTIAGDATLWTARVDPSGSVLDQSLVPVPTEFDARQPNTVFAGGDWLVVWVEYEFGYQIKGARVSPDGDVTSPTIEIAQGASLSEMTSLAFNGESALVVWARAVADGISHFEAAFVDAAGQVTPVTSPLPSEGIGSAIVWTDDDFIMVYERTDPGSPASDDVWMVTVSADSAAVSEPSLLSAIPAPQRKPEMAKARGRYLVVWEEVVGGTDEIDVYGSILEVNGTVVVPTFPISVEPGRQRAPDVASNGKNFFVVWQHLVSRKESEIHGTAVTADGHVRDIGGKLIRSNQDYAPSVASEGKNYVVAWHHGCFCSHQPSGIEARRISASNKFLDKEPLTIAFEDKRDAKNAYPEVAAGDDEYLVVWLSDARLAKSTVKARHILPGGSMKPAFTIATSPNIWVPEVSYSRGNFMVAWSLNSAIGLATISTESRTPDMGPRLKTPDSPFALSDILSNGRNSLVAWTVGIYSPRTRVQFLTASGKPTPSIDRVNGHTPSLVTTAKGRPALVFARETPLGGSAIYFARWKL